MALLDEKEALPLYVGLMEEIKVRLSAIDLGTSVSFRFPLRWCENFRFFKFG